MKISVNFMLICVLLASFLSSCQAPAPAAPAATAPSSATPAPPSATPIPPTPVPPTQTPLPSPTPVPPTPTVALPPIFSEFLDVVQVLEYDAFDDLEGWYTWNDGSGKLADGAFKVTGQKDFTSALVFNRKISPNQGVFLKFKVAKLLDYRSEFVFARGNWQTDSFRQFGIYNGRTPKADLIQGKNALGYNNLHGNLVLLPDTWYCFMAAVGENGEFLAVIWNPDKPARQDIYHETIGEKWAGRDYDFQAKADLGENLYVEDFYLFSFSAIK